MEQTECDRCGTCCIKGGPVLHKQDYDLAKDGYIPRGSLITIRKGELAYNPKTDTIGPVSCELIKIAGKGGEWSCLYYDESVKECKIYLNRPFACTILKCWNPKELLDLVENDTLSRFDIVDGNDPMYLAVLESDRLFPCPDMKEIAAWSEDIFNKQKAGLEKLINEDLNFRTQLVRLKGLALSDELFLFGRPLFQLLQPLGFSIVQGSNGIKLQFKKSRL